jgi:hypothetical protein
LVFSGAEPLATEYKCTPENNYLQESIIKEERYFLKATEPSKRLKWFSFWVYLTTLYQLLSSYSVECQHDYELLTGKDVEGAVEAYFKIHHVIRKKEAGLLTGIRTLYLPNAKHEC